MPDNDKPASACTPDKQTTILLLLPRILLIPLTFMQLAIVITGKQGEQGLLTLVTWLTLLVAHGIAAAALLAHVLLTDRLPALSRAMPCGAILGIAAWLLTTHELPWKYTLSWSGVAYVAAILLDVFLLRGLRPHRNSTAHDQSAT